MASQCDCCGCVFESDYGTTLVTGSGDREDPFVIEQASTPYVRPVARVRRSTNQSIPNNTATAISFDTEVFDTANFWTVGSPTLITIPHTGLYIFGGNTQWAVNITGTRELLIRLNGSTIIQTNDQPPHPSFNNTRPIWQTVGYQYRLTAGNTLELLARQESGGALNAVAEADDAIAFWIMYAGRTI